MSTVVYRITFGDYYLKCPKSRFQLISCIEPLLLTLNLLETNGLLHKKA